MANYNGMTRTNYFKVKDGEKFLAEIADWNVEPFTREVDGETYYGFYDNDPNGQGLMWSRYLEDEDGSDLDEEEERDWLAWLASHLQDGQVAIIMDIGWEKYRYFAGSATAVNSKGETRSVDLSDIYDLGKELGESITVAQY